MKKNEKPILVVKDYHQSGDILTRTLDEAGYRVHTARNAVEALDAVKQRRFEVAVIDYHLPWSSGLELMAISHIVWQQTPVVLLSLNHPEIWSLAVQHGSCVWLHKPFDPDRLLMTIHAATHLSVAV